jgi:hypothetical protein
MDTRTWTSAVTYQRDPAVGGPLFLGVLVEAKLGARWAVAICARQQLTEAEVAALDPIAAQLLVAPMEFLREQVKTILHLEAREGGLRPGDILRRIACRNAFSICVATPEERGFDRSDGNSPNDAALEGFAFEYYGKLLVEDAQTPANVVPLIPGRPVVRRRKAIESEVLSVPAGVALSAMG